MKLSRKKQRKSVVLWRAAACSLMFLSSSSYGSNLDTDKIRGKTKAKPVSVLQNRYFVKAYRPEVGILAGTMLNEAYTNTRFVGFRVGMFFSEWMGFEVQSFSTSVSDTDDKQALAKLKYGSLEQDENGNTQVATDEDGNLKVVGVYPEVNPIRSVLDLNAIAAPFYGKVSLLNKFIVYSDFYVSGGLSQVKTDQKNHLAFSIGGGMRVYFSNSFSFRLDVKDRIYTEKRGGKDSRKNAYSVDLGASYFFR